MTMVGRKDEIEIACRGSVKARLGETSTAFFLPIYPVFAFAFALACPCKLDEVDRG